MGGYAGEDAPDMRPRCRARTHTFLRNGLCCDCGYTRAELIADAARLLEHAGYTVTPRLRKDAT